MQPHGLQHTRPPCPSSTPRAFSKSCPSSWRCHLTISSSVVPFSSCLSIFPSIRVFSRESVLHIRWSEFWSFSFRISPSNEYSGLISFTMDKLDQSCQTLRPHRQQPTRLLCPWDSPGKNTGVGCHFLLQCMKVKSESEVTQSCPTLSDPMDCSPPGSSVQARVLEWGAIAFSTL